MIEQENFTGSALGKFLEKQTKTIENQGKKKIQLKSMENNKVKLMCLFRKMILIFMIVKINYC